MIGDLLKRYKSMEFKEVSYPTTFVPDFLESLKKKQCPMCFHKLYLMQKAKLYYCKSLKCPQRVANKKSYIVGAGKVDRCAPIK